MAGRDPSDGLVLSGRDKLLYGTTELGNGPSSPSYFIRLAKEMIKAAAQQLNPATSENLQKTSVSFQVN